MKFIETFEAWSSDAIDKFVNSWQNDNDISADRIVDIRIQTIWNGDGPRLYIATVIYLFNT